MQLLFNEKLYPITCEMGFIESDFFDVIKFYIKWQSKIFRQYGVKLIKRDVSGNLEYVLKSLLPLISILPNRFLFIPTKSRWIMFLDNSHQGTDAQSSMAYMARKMNCRSLRVVACSDTLVGNTGWLGATILSMYGKDIPGQYNCIRSIGVINEGDEKRDRWSFDQFGTPFDFEDVKSKISKRLETKYKNRFRVVKVPNITNICYGRGVGYKIEEVVLSEEIQKISATNIRKKMREKGDLK